MENASVIFDTNAYRSITLDLNQEQTLELFDLINEIEREKNIKTFAAHVVASELLSHLNDAKDPHFYNCRNAAIAIYHHNINDEEGNLRFIADSESQLCRILYKKTSPHELELSAQINYDLNYIYNRKPDDDLEEISEYLDDLKLKIKRSEDQFVKDMWDHVVKTANPDAVDWNDVRDNKEARMKALEYLRYEGQSLETAKALVIKTMLILGIKEENEFEEMAKYLNKIFVVPIKFYNQILEKILISGANVEKKSRPNWIWDMQLAFYIGKKSSVLGSNTFLITSDKEIISAANESDCKDYVLTTEEYLQELGI